jgi:glyoxylase-like metal-dependent hydrolase (beta-lactamase superfamily II)
MTARASRRLFAAAVLVCASLASAAPARAQRADAKTLLEQAAKAMGGIAALRALKSQIVESEGKQFEHASVERPGGPSRQTAEFRATLTRDLTAPRLRLDWEARRLGQRAESIQYAEVIDGSVGLLEEGAGADVKPGRLHPARLASRLREEKRAAARLVVNALGQKSLKRLADVALGRKIHPVVAFKDVGDEFRVYLDPKTKLPVQTEILEDDPIEGDSRYTLRYSDWRAVEGVLVPFALRYELNGKPLQEERVLSVRHNATLYPEAFAIPETIRAEKPDAKPIASQWVLRRVAGNASYQDFGRDPPVEMAQLADGVFQARGTSHNTIVIEMRDYLIAVEAPLYDERSQAVIQAIKARFAGKPIRYVIPTHFHIDHSGGIRGYMAEGAIVTPPEIAREFYTCVAHARHRLRPDTLEKNGHAVTIESHDGPRAIVGSNRYIVIYPLPTSHAADLQVVYLPREKILIEADHANPRKNQIRPGPLAAELLAGIEKLRLDVATIAGIHGDTADMDALRAAAKNGEQPAAPAAEDPTEAPANIVESSLAPSGGC